MKNRKGLSHIFSIWLGRGSHLLNKIINFLTAASGWPGWPGLAGWAWPGLAWPGLAWPGLSGLAGLAGLPGRHTVKPPILYRNGWAAWASHSKTSNSI